MHRSPQRSRLVIFCSGLTLLAGCATSPPSADTPSAERRAAAAYVLLGYGRLTSHEYDAAIDELNRALTLDPDWAPAFAYRGLAYLGKGNLEMAARDFDAGYVRDSHNWLVFMGRGELALLENRFPEAIAALTTSLQLKPETNEALWYRAEAYAKSGERDKALADGAEMIRLRPKSMDGYDARGTTFLNGGEYALAVPEYEKAVAIDSKSALLRARLGMAYFGIQDKVLARKNMDAALALDPHESEALLGSGVLSYDAGDVPTAIEAWNRTLALDPHNVSALYWRARAYWHASEPDKALVDCQEVLRLAPHYQDAVELCAHIAQSQAKGGVAKP
jgi:tetratricopeptide (TPR) repeat protein